MDEYDGITFFSRFPFQLFWYSFHIRSERYLANCVCSYHSSHHATDMCEVATQQFNQLQDLFRRVLQRREEQLGAKHLQTLAAVRNLAKNLRSQQKFKEAEDREAKTCSFQFSKWLSEGLKIGALIPLIVSALLDATGKIHQSLEGFGRFWKLPCLGCRNFIGEPWKAMKISWASQIKKLYVWLANWQPYYRTVRMSGVKTQGMLI